MFHILYEELHSNLRVTLHTNANILYMGGLGKIETHSLSTITRFVNGRFKTTLFGPT